MKNNMPLPGGSFVYFILAIWLAIVGLVIFVAHHFIAKYW